MTAPLPESTVLVAEDNPVDLFLIRSAAQKLSSGVRFEFVGDGEEVVSYLNGVGEFADRGAHPYPVLILTHVHLRKLNGFEVLSWIRLQPKHATTRVVMWSDLELPGELSKAKHAGAECIMRRPIGIEALTKSLAEIIQMLGQTGIRQ